MSGDDKHREELCPDCLAFPQDMDQRIIVGRVDGTTGETWHKDGCPRYGEPPQLNDEPTA